MQYSNAQVVWCQEEPKNMGAWRYMKPRMDTAMRELMKSREGSMPPSRIRYVGRPAAASPGLSSSPLLTAVKICVLLMHAELFKFGKPYGCQHGRIQHNEQGSDSNEALVMLTCAVEAVQQVICICCTLQMLRH